MLDGSGSALSMEVADGAVDASVSGPYAAGFTFVRVVDSTRNVDIGGRPVPAYVFYPLDPASVTADSPRAMYPMDPLYDTLPKITSLAYEAAGIDPAFENVMPAAEGEFPLAIFSSGWNFDSSLYIFLGARLATHGIVVAIITHAHDGVLSIPSDPLDSPAASMLHRPQDMSFMLTSILAANESDDPFWGGLIDEGAVAAAGHSMGGYAALALAGGDANVCDSAEYSYGPQPPETCVTISKDKRFHAVISLDGASYLLSAAELGSIKVPYISIGEDIAGLDAQGLESLNGRAHVYAGSRHSYRVDLNHATHESLTNFCDNIPIWYYNGIMPNANVPADLVQFFYTFYCGVPTGALNGDSVLPSQVSYSLVTKYMVAFIKTRLGDEEGYRWMLEPKCGQQQEENIDFFVKEAGGDLHDGPGIYWLPPQWGAEEYDYYGRQTSVACKH